MKPLDQLPPRDDEGHYHVVVESPRDAAVKLKYDPSLGAFTLSRTLPAGLVYPGDWGFVPSTLASDGDPLDALVLTDAPAFPGVVHKCRLVGVVKVTQKKKGGGGRESNDRILAVPHKALRLSDLTDARALPERVRREIDLFFSAAVALEDKELRREGWDGPTAAARLVDEAIAGAKSKQSG